MKINFSIGAFYRSDKEDGCAIRFPNMDLPPGYKDAPSFAKDVFGACDTMYGIPTMSELKRLSAVFGEGRKGTPTKLTADEDKDLSIKFIWLVQRLEKKGMIKKDEYNGFQLIVAYSDVKTKEDIDFLIARGQQYN